MPIIEQQDIHFLWKKNSHRLWIQHLLNSFNSGQGKDFEIIRYWIEQFKKGAVTKLIVDINYVILDGHHRLISAKIIDLENIDVIICPQRTTYS